MKAFSVQERPILFSGPMVRAILDGRKTQTRRVMNPQPQIGIPDEFIGWTAWNESVSTHDKRLEASNEASVVDEWMCPYGYPGSRLWVREAWGLHDTEPSDGPDNAQVYYRATDGDRHDLRYQKWRPSIHMPRWASRISLEVTDVRTERVQRITEGAAIAEGAQCAGVPASLTNRGAFAKLWDQLNGERGFGWEVDPWVWVVTFKLASFGPHSRPKP